MGELSVEMQDGAPVLLLWRDAKPNRRESDALQEIMRLYSCSYYSRASRYGAWLMRV